MIDDKQWKELEIEGRIEEHHSCFRVGSYFMTAVLAAAIYYKGVSVIALLEVWGVLWFQVEVRSTWNLEQYTLTGNLLVPDVCIGISSSDNV